MGNFEDIVMEILGIDYGKYLKRENKINDCKYDYMQDVETLSRGLYNTDNTYTYDKYDKYTVLDSMLATLEYDYNTGVDIHVRESLYNVCEEYCYINHIDLLERIDIYCESRMCTNKAFKGEDYEYCNN